MQPFFYNFCLNLTLCNFCLFNLMSLCFSIHYHVKINEPMPLLFLIWHKIFKIEFDIFTELVRSNHGFLLKSYKIIHFVKKI